MILSPTCLFITKEKNVVVSVLRAMIGVSVYVVVVREKQQQRRKNYNNFSLSAGFCENLKRSRREGRKRRKKIARAYNSYKPMNARDRR